MITRRGLPPLMTPLSLVDVEGAPATDEPPTVRVFRPSALVHPALGFAGPPILGPPPGAPPAAPGAPAGRAAPCAPPPSSSAGPTRPARRRLATGCRGAAAPGCPAN